jgi:hypothetical protein
MTAKELCHSRRDAFVIGEGECAICGVRPLTGAHAPNRHLSGTLALGSIDPDAAKWDTCGGDRQEDLCCGWSDATMRRRGWARCWPGLLMGRQHWSLRARLPVLPTRCCSGADRPGGARTLPGIMRGGGVGARPRPDRVRGSGSQLRRTGRSDGRLVSPRGHRAREVKPTGAWGASAGSRNEHTPLSSGHGRSGPATPPFPLARRDRDLRVH